MNWKKAAIEDLQRYAAQKDSLKNINERAIAVTERMRSVKGATLDSVPTHTGGTAQEDKILDCLVEKERLKWNYRYVNRIISLIERGLENLDEQERLVLERFYVTPRASCVETLMRELDYEKSSIYRIRDKALYKFTIHMYGLIDS